MLAKGFTVKLSLKVPLKKKKKIEKSNREKGKGKRVEGQGEDRKTDSFSPNCQSVLSEVLALLQKQLNNFKQCVCFIERSNRSFDTVPHVPTLLLPIVRSKQFKFREATSWENDRREGLALRPQQIFNWSLKLSLVLAKRAGSQSPGKSQQEPASFLFTECRVRRQEPRSVPFFNYENCSKKNWKEQQKYSNCNCNQSPFHGSVPPPKCLNSEQTQFTHFNLGKLSVLKKAHKMACDTVISHIPHWHFLYYANISILTLGHLLSVFAFTADFGR